MEFWVLDFLLYVMMFCLGLEKRMVLKGGQDCGRYCSFLSATCMYTQKLSRTLLWALKSEFNLGVGVMNFKNTIFT